MSFRKSEILAVSIIINLMYIIKYKNMYNKSNFGCFIKNQLIYAVLKSRHS